MKIIKFRFLLTGLGLFILDQTIKQYIIKKLPLEGVSWFKFIYLKLELNPDLALSLPTGNLLASFLSAGVLAILIVYIVRVKQNFTSLAQLGLVLIITGALSNLLDRLLYGGVIDYFHFWNLSVFNFSDLMILSGIILFFLSQKGLNKPTSR